MISINLVQRLNNSYLYGILDTGYLSPSEMPAMAKKLIAGGIDILQLRAKNSTEEEIVAMGATIQPLTKKAGVLFIINDYPHLVSKIKADGVHIGQDDIGIAEAREKAGDQAIVGLSTHSLEQIDKAVHSKPDYIAFGPLFETPTKPDYIPIGTDNIIKAEKIASFPVFCIGGITEKNLPSIMTSGAKRVVIVSSLLKAENPEKKTKYCRNVLLKTRDEALLA